MKASRKKLTPPFTPFEFSIVIESEEEARALYAVLNLTKNDRLIGCNKASYLKEVLGKEYYVHDVDEVIANGITYLQYYKEK